MTTEIKAHDYTLKNDMGMWDVRISPTTEYGYFEHCGTGTGGGLWFNGLVLIDYDGVFELSNAVILACEALGYDMAYAKDDEEKGGL